MPPIPAVAGPRCYDRPLRRVLMVLPYANWAGTERHVLTLGSELSARGWDVTVLSPPGPATQWWRDANLKVETFAPQAEGIRRMVSSLRQRANAWVTRGRDGGGAPVKAGIVHVHGAPELLFLLRHLRPTTGMVFTSHGFVGHNVGWDYWWAALAGRRWADAVVAVSETEATRLLQHGLPPSRLKVIRNGIAIPPPRCTRPRVSAADSCCDRSVEPGYGPAVWSVGFVGRLTPEKGLEYLLQALPLALARLRAEQKRPAPKAGVEGEAKAKAEAQAEGEAVIPRIKLWVLGDGPERRRLHELARRLTEAEPGLEVEFVGAVADVASWWQRFDIFVLPSLDESFGLVVAEAMASGLPVIASRLPATAETILDGQSGLLVPPADPAALASALVRLMIDSELRQRLAEQAQRYARDNLSAACMASLTERLYLQVLSLDFD
ncbi:MAG: glycosyltransferase family 4 protein [Limnochordales bacterium]|nr:glycosyltransferase family 4 protein [Limnochordales bacterium]